MKILEHLSRAEAVRYYSHRFQSSKDDKTVAVNVDANWMIFSPTIAGVLLDLKKLGVEIPETTE